MENNFEKIKLSEQEEKEPAEQKKAEFIKIETIEHKKDKMPFSGCGIVGSLNLEQQENAGIEEKRFDDMVDSLQHRGPSGRGVLKKDEIQLGHRRLSILDLSERGSQPMERENLSISYNGEVYNFSDIRKELEADGVDFSSQTDTEVVLRAYQKWGPDALKKFNGMFAISIWDDSKKELFLARDRMGIKPLYYHKSDKNFLFGSEIQALMKSGEITAEIDWDSAFQQVLTTSNFQDNEEKTLIKNVYSLPAGHFMTIKPDGQSQITKYWDLPDTKFGNVSENEIVEELKKLLNDSVRLRLVSDVPVGAFLSGGMDSSTINAIASSLTKEYKLQSYFLKFEGINVDPNTQMMNLDERYSNIMAETLKDLIDFHIVKIKTSETTTEKIDMTIDLASFSDEMRLPAILQNYQTINEQGLKVVLNGQGADEIMGGYVAFSKIYDTLFNLRHPQDDLLNKFYPATLMPDRDILSKEVLDRSQKVASDLYRYYQEFSGNAMEKGHRFLTKTLLQRILRFEDFLSMKFGIETRLPFLDYRIVEWAFRNSFENHIRENDKMGKMLLRKATKDILPPEIIERQKQAFPLEQDILKKSLASIYQEHRGEITKSEIAQRVFNEEFLKVENPQISLHDLWRMISMWRWGKKLEEYKVKNNA